MSQIFAISDFEPNFPATDQHPDAVRYQVGDRWIDAVGGEPTQQEIDAIINPAIQKVAPSPAQQLADLLVAKGVITSADAALFDPKPGNADRS